MAISFPTLSLAYPQAMFFGPVGNTQVHTSPLSRSERTLTTPGMRWRMSLTYHGLGEADQALLMGFFADLEGAGGRFTHHPPHRVWPRGTCRSVTVTASAGTVLLTSLTFSSLGASKTLLIGDFFAIGGHLYCITANATADGAGSAIVSFKPGLRAAHNLGTAVTVYKPLATWKLMSDENGSTFRPGRLADVTVDAMESWA